jgi:hypothetical protein
MSAQPQTYLAIGFAVGLFWQTIDDWVRGAASAWWRSRKARSISTMPIPMGLSAHDLRVGDPVWFEFPTSWWQFWLRWPFRRRYREYRITKIETSTINLEDSK